MKLVRGLALIVVLGGGCKDSAAGDDDGGSSETGTDGSTGADSTSTSTSSGPTADASTTQEPTGDTTGAIASCALSPGEHIESIEVGGVTRDFAVWVGQQQGAEPPAVLFAWHGFGQSAGWQLQAVDPAGQWNDAVVVAPQGLERTLPGFPDPGPGWQLSLGELEDRDVAFFDALVLWLSERGCLDATRVYATGFSNGAYFSNVLGCHRGEVLAGIAPVSGGGPYVTPCGRSVAVQITHGRSDGIVTFDNALTSYGHWTSHDVCSPDNAYPDDGCATAAGCEVPVEACSFDGGHEWRPDQAERLATFLRAQVR
jgi:polyhydroxybutyrate depolymerase